MRHSKIRKQLAKPAKPYTTAEKLRRRRVKHTQGPSAVRRKERRKHLQPGESQGEKGAGQ